MAYNVFVPQYTDRSEAKRTRDIIEATDWNELWNLNSSQGDHSESYLNDLKIYLFGAANPGLTGKMAEIDAALDSMDVVVMYQKASQGLTPPTGTWSSGIPEVSAGEYLWTRFQFALPEGTKTGYSVSYRAADGTGSGDMMKTNYDPGNTVYNAGGITAWTNAQTFVKTADLSTYATQAWVNAALNNYATNTDLTTTEAAIYAYINAIDPASKSYVDTKIGQITTALEALL